MLAASKYAKRAALSALVAPVAVAAFASGSVSAAHASPSAPQSAAPRVTAQHSHGATSAHPGAAATATSTVAGPSVWVWANGVRIRTGPGVGFPAVGVVNAGQGIDIHCKAGGTNGSGFYPLWVRGHLWGGGEQYISSNFLAGALWLGSKPWC
ncbi:hypothetical protein HUW46_09260 [Amycolatopsis sp. CA-230715]|nr:hypothetical protein HUW46_09260 [Amycolatopsis sp. CA-230715]